MQNVQIRVQILIPTHNDVNLIDETMASIRSQNYDKEDIYIIAVDFESTDGTYEKLLTYDNYHFGIYQYKGKYTRSTMTSLAARLKDFTNPGGEYNYILTLNPGDIIYPDFLRKMTQYMYEYRTYNPRMVIGEVDIIRKSDGKKVNMTSIYDSKHVIEGKSKGIEFVSKGFNHNIICFGGAIATAKYRAAGILNERIWWNKNITSGNFERNIIYTPERLACIRERFYEDELKEILLRYEAIILFIRSYESKFLKSMDSSFEMAAEENLCNYALWRSYLLYGNGEIGQALECYKIISIISPLFTQKLIYSMVGEFIKEGKTTNKLTIDKYFYTN